MKNLNCTDWRPRVNIDVSPETFAKLRILRHGMKKVVLGMLIDAVAEELERDPASFVSAVMSKDINIRNLLKLEQKDATG